jgi:hypothetical protein
MDLYDGKPSMIYSPSENSLESQGIFVRIDIKKIQATHSGLS